MTRTVAAILLIAGSSWAFDGCKDNTPACVPATVVTGCICNTGNVGYEVCASDGLAYDACLCGSPPADGGVTDGVDASKSDLPASDATDD
jgi:hypothetical protein